MEPEITLLYSIPRPGWTLWRERHLRESKDVEVSCSDTEGETETEFMLHSSHSRRYPENRDAGRQNTGRRSRSEKMMVEGLLTMVCKTQASNL